MGDVVTPVDEVPTAQPDEDVLEVLPKLEGDPSRALVTEGHR